MGQRVYVKQGGAYEMGPVGGRPRAVANVQAFVKCHAKQTAYKRERRPQE